MTRCAVCGRDDLPVSSILSVCRYCIIEGGESSAELVLKARAEARKKYGLPACPPRSENRKPCRLCGNSCVIREGEKGFCGLRINSGGRIRNLTGTARSGLVIAYHDPLPTNCVAAWVCPGSSNSGFPEFSYAPSAEIGYTNLAVFLAACTFDCLFCQNHTFRENTANLYPVRSPENLVDMVTRKDSCVCFFGGDPSAQAPFAIASARRILQAVKGRIFRVCWETNGLMSQRLLKRICEISLHTGGCVKFDLKAFDENLHKALTGVSNKQTLYNFQLSYEIMKSRPEPPPLVASTLMVPGYVESEEVLKIARFIASVDPKIPHSLLAFHPDYLMNDLGTTTRKSAIECLEAARSAGLENVSVGNIHLLS